MNALPRTRRRIVRRLQLNAHTAEPTGHARNRDCFRTFAFAAHTISRTTNLESNTMNDPYRIVVQPEQSIDWLTKASCRTLGLEAADLWFPSYRSGQTAAKFRQRVEEWPKEVCAGCPVKAECYEYGKDDHFGIYGGVAEGERFPKPPRKFSKAGA